MLFPQFLSWLGRSGEANRTGVKSSVTRSPVRDGGVPPLESASGVAVGTTGVGQTLKSERDEAALCSLNSDRASESLSGQVVRPKKSVAFSFRDDIRTLPASAPEEAKVPERNTKSSTIENDLESRWRGEEIGFVRMRAFNWSMRRWWDIFQPQNGKTDGSGVKRLMAMSDRLHQSEPVKRAMAIFAEARCLNESGARNPLSEVVLPRGLLFSARDLEALDVAREELLSILRENKPQLADLAWRASCVQRSVSIGALSDVGSPYHGALLPLTIENSPRSEEVSLPVSWEFLIDGQQTSVGRNQVSVLFWAELLAGIGSEREKRVESLADPKVCARLHVTVINDK